MIDAVVKDRKTLTITIFHMPESLEERLNMINRDMEDIKRHKSNF